MHSTSAVMAEKKSLEARNRKFYLDGKEVTLRSGAVHYFRVVPEYWRDRLQRVKACGLNCVETYVAWNWHEESQGEFNFKGNRDLRKFIQIAHELGLYVIFRPGPYICAEWDFGGLPSWLLHDPTMQVRSFYKPYIDAVDAYLEKLFAQVVDLQYSKGGPIIAVQLENEYGSYGNDSKYKQFLIDTYKKNGLCELFFTSDNGVGIQTGDFPNALITANFQEQEHGYLMFEYLKNVKQPNMPLMVMEFWSGWFDHWGEKHHVWPVSEFHKVFNWILDQDSSVNLYMFHGGTNWGFMNGANQDKGATNEAQPEPYGADVTSYDYDAPVAENGDLTEKWEIVRTAMIKRFVSQESMPEIPKPIESISYGTCKVESWLALEDVMKYTSTAIHSKNLLSMEQLEINNGGGQGYGFILYRKRIGQGSKLVIKGKVKDRAVIYLNGKETGSVEWQSGSETICLSATNETNVLDILVENMGRVNYGNVETNMMNQQRKGLTGDVLLDGKLLDSWEIYPLEFKENHIESLSKCGSWNECTTDKKGPSVNKVTLVIEGQPKDTFISMKGWMKGSIFVNGFNLGRYWDRGPQETLFLPAPLLKQGSNEILIFEVHRSAESISFESKAALGATVKHTTITPFSSKLQIWFLKTALFFGDWTWNIIRLVM